MNFPTERFAVVEIVSAAGLRQWLEEHHGQAESVWLMRYMNHVADKTVPIDAILDELLCFGWVDGLARKLDADRTLRLISPRRHQRWTRSYKERAARLISEGRMAAPGLRAIEESKQRGEWNDQDEVDDLLVPEDLDTALRQNPQALAFFTSAAPSYRRNVLRWLKLAKKPDTRAKRIGQTIALSTLGEKVPQM
jgi:uncharacterized protein YdeI (YjbR/CyaY-like superfamily)